MGKLERSKFGYDMVKMVLCYGLHLFFDLFVNYGLVFNNNEEQLIRQNITETFYNQRIASIMGEKAKNCCILSGSTKFVFAIFNTSQSRTRVLDIFREVKFKYLSKRKGRATAGS